MTAALYHGGTEITEKKTSLLEPLLRNDSIPSRKCEVRVAPLPGFQFASIRGPKSSLFLFAAFAPFCGKPALFSCLSWAHPPFLSFPNPCHLKSVVDMAFAGKKRVSHGFHGLHG